MIGMNFKMENSTRQILFQKLVYQKLKIKGQSPVISVVKIRSVVTKGR